MKVNGFTELGMEVHIIKINSQMKSISDSSKTDLDKAREELYIQMEVSMQVIFIMIFLMALEFFSMSIKINMMVILLKVKDKGKESIFTVKVQYFSENGAIIPKFQVN